MIIRSVIHVMPWEIDHLFLLQHQLKRSSYYLNENDKFEMDVVLNLSDKLIDWDKSKLDKQFFIDKYKSTQYLTDWATCRYTIYEGNKMYGHLDLMKECINDNITCDSYMSIVPDIHFHETLLYYMFRSIDVIQNDYYWVTAQIPKLWDDSWDLLVNDDYIDVSYENHRSIDTYDIENSIRNYMHETQIFENITGKYKWACWFDLHSAKLLELINLPDEWTGYGPMDTFYIQLADMFREYNILNFKHFIIKNQIIADRWRCIDKKDDDPSTANHSQDTPLREFYISNLSSKNTKKQQRKNINRNFEKNIVDALNKVCKASGDQRRFQYAK